MNTKPEIMVLKTKKALVVFLINFASLLKDLLPEKTAF